MCDTISIFFFKFPPLAIDPSISLWLMRLPSTAASLALVPLLMMMMTDASSASGLALDSDLFYVTASNCDSVPTLTQQELVHALFASAQSFQGQAELSTEAAASNAGCRLHLQVRGDLAVDNANAFQVTSSLHQMLMQLLQQPSALRGSSSNSTDLKDLALTRVLVKTDAKDFTLTLDEAEFMKPSSQMITSGGCAQLKAQDVLPQILPHGVTGGELDSLATVGNNPDRSDCSVAVDLVAQVQPSHERNVFSLLQDLDNNLESVYADQTLLHANIKVQQHPSDATAALDTTTPLNLPSKTIVLGILFGISALTAMLLGILATKSRHEKRCEERYNKASRAAQISRVSIRMGYEGLPREAMEDEEEKEELL